MVRVGPTAASAAGGVVDDGIAELEDVEATGSGREMIGSGLDDGDAVVVAAASVDAGTTGGEIVLFAADSLLVMMGAEVEVEVEDGKGCD